MNTFSFLNFSAKKVLCIFLLFLFGLGAFFLYQGYRRNGQKYQYNFYRYLPFHEAAPWNIHGQAQWEEPWENAQREKSDLGSRESLKPIFPFYYPDMGNTFKNCSRPTGEIIDRVKISQEFSPLHHEKNFSDIASFDRLRRGYYLRSVHPADTPQAVLEAMSTVLQILNRQDVPSDYFLYNEYQKAYDIIDTYYFDVYVWEHLTNATARKNLFLHLFTKYAQDNKNWKLYEKDVSDCTQYSQRVYLFMDPGEVFIEEDYFQFLFSEDRAIKERKKLCNKIPTVLYTLLEPYVLKKEDYISGHAMIAFSPDEKLDELILGEPQTGEFRSIEDDIGDILDEEFTQYNAIFHLGKIINIQDDMKHEATIDIAGGYFFPKALLSNDSSDDGLNGGRNNRPIVLDTQNWYVCNLLSYAIAQTLSNQSYNWSNLLSMFEGTIEQENLTQDQTKEMMNTSLDVISYGMNGLNPSDIRSLQDNMFYLGEGYSPQLQTMMNSYCDLIHAFGL